MRGRGWCGDGMTARHWSRGVGRLRLRLRMGGDCQLRVDGMTPWRSRNEGLGRLCLILRVQGGDSQSRAIQLLRLVPRVYRGGDFQLRANGMIPRRTNSKGIGRICSAPHVGRQGNHQPRANELLPRGTKTIEWFRSVPRVYRGGDCQQQTNEITPRATMNEGMQRLCLGLRMHQ